MATPRLHTAALLALCLSGAMASAPASALAQRCADTEQAWVVRAQPGQSSTGELVDALLARTLRTRAGYREVRVSPVPFSEVRAVLDCQEGDCPAQMAALLGPQTVFVRSLSGRGTQQVLRVGRVLPEGIEWAHHALPNANAVDALQRAVRGVVGSLCRPERPARGEPPPTNVHPGPAPDSEADGERTAQAPPAHKADAAEGAGREAGWRAPVQGAGWSSVVLGAAAGGAALASTLQLRDTRQTQDALRVRTAEDAERATLLEAQARDEARRARGLWGAAGVLIGAGAALVGAAAWQKDAEPETGAGEGEGADADAAGPSLQGVHARVGRHGAALELWGTL